MAHRGPINTITIAITTFSRPDSCLRLLKDIERWRKTYRVRVTVFDDCSPDDYREVQGFLRAQGWQWVRSNRNHGKKLWWKWVSDILARWSRDASDYFYFIQDDIRLCDDFFTRTIQQWEQISDPRKMALYLLRDEQRDKIGVQCWTAFKSRIEGTVERTQWLDCNAFLCTSAMVKMLDGRLDPIPPKRWKSNPTLSSGVGRQMSVRLTHLKGKIYRTLHSYVLHMDEKSSMNPDVRLKNPLRAVRYIDGPDKEAALYSEYETITASLATIPSRRHTLKNVVARLLPQVDKLNVYLNETPKVVGGDGYPNLPDFLKHPKIEAVWSRDTEFGDQGDAGKFYWSGTIRGWHIVVDDDVLYPPDFVKTLVEGAERYGRRCAVGFHGATLTEPFRSYYKCREVKHFALEVRRDTPVHILASNSLCYHSSTIKVHRDDFKHPNMGDIWFGLLAQQQRIPLITLKHVKGWMVDDTSTRADSIYAHSTKKRQSQKNTADVQTRVVQQNMPWHVRDSHGRVLRTLGDANRSPTHLPQVPVVPDHKAAFLTATTNRPLLLAACLKSLQEQLEVPADWGIDIMVAGSANDPGRVIAEAMGATYLVVEGSTPGHKINALLKETTAELIMLADDDDIQSPYRAKAAISAHTSGYKWSSVGQWWCINTTTGAATVWKGTPALVGTTISVTTSAARAAGGWPTVPRGKDGHFESRMKGAPLKDVTDDCGMTTVQLQHGVNIWRKRPFPANGHKQRHGKYMVYGKGRYDQAPGLPQHTRRLLEALVLNSGAVGTCVLCSYQGVFGDYRGRANAQCPRCGSLKRHRRQAEWLQEAKPQGQILHAAPNPSLAKFLSSLGTYTSIDIRPEVGTDVVGDLRDLPFDNNTFGLVVISHVLEHIVEVDTAISEVYRVLKPGGFALLDVPYFDRPETKSIPRDEHDHVWEPGHDWSNRYREAGFDVVKEHASGTTLCRRKP